MSLLVILNKHNYWQFINKYFKYGLNMGKYNICFWLVSQGDSICLTVYIVATNWLVKVRHDIFSVRILNVEFCRSYVGQTFIFP